MLKIRYFSLQGLLFGIFCCVISCQTGQKNEISPNEFSSIRPPISELNPAFSKFQLDGATGGNWFAESGSQITIPADALTDAEGRPVNGLVDFEYREMHQAADIFLAGIPMNYGTGNFSTAGTFELRAFQNRKPVFLKNGAAASVCFASFTAGDDFQFYFFDEQKLSWDSLGYAAAEVNKEKITAQKRISGLQPELKFPLNRQYFAFNYEAILDISFPSTYPVSKELQTQLNAKLEKYGLGWEQAEVWQRITFRGNEEHAGLMVWKNLEKKPFPDWTHRMYGKLEPLRRDQYEYTVVHEKDTNLVFKAKLEAVMPLRQLFAFEPEKWKNEYKKTMALIAAEEARMQNLAEVFRSFELSGFGIYNWDKILEGEQSAELAGEFEWDAPLNEKLSEMTVTYISGDNRAIINYPKSSWAKMMLQKDAGGRLFAILPGNKVAIFGREQYARLDFESLKKENDPACVFEMSSKPVEPFSRAGFQKVLGF